MRVLHAISTLSREAGGLPVAVTGLAAALAEGCPALEPEILAAGPHAPGAATVDLPRGIRIDLARRPGAFLAGRHRAEPFALMHQHGLWSPWPVAAGRFAAARGLPLVLSPHGMLEAWALRHHAWRKRLAWLLYQRRNLGAAAVLHAASAPEADQFRRLGLAAPAAVIPHGVLPRPEAPLDPAAAAAPKERPQVLFLSRVHPKKGVDLLLEVWAGLPAAKEWELVIAGNDDGGHQPALQARARRLGLARGVRFAGPLFGAEKDTAFRRADLFILPSHSENFAIVVAEALQYGLPVITTTGTPWENLPREGCGWRVSPAVGPLREALAEALSLSPERRKEMGRRGAELVEREHRWPTLAGRYRDLYRWLAGEGERPDCVLR